MDTALVATVPVTVAELFLAVDVAHQLVVHLLLPAADHVAAAQAATLVAVVDQPAELLALDTAQAWDWAAELLLLDQLQAQLVVLTFDVGFLAAFSSRFLTRLTLLSEFSSSTRTT